MANISLQVPVVIGEIGAKINYDSDNKEYLFLQNSLQIFNEWHLSYIGWVWWDAGTSFDELERNTELTTGGTVNKYGQLLVNAIASG